MGAGFGRATADGGRDGQLGCGPGCRHCSPENFPRRTFLSVYFFNVCNTGILVTDFAWLFLSRICVCFKFSGCNFKINMNKSNVKYLRVVTFSQ